MLTAYRIFKTVHASKWFDGEGSYLYGGRWNSPGIRVLYAAASLSLAALEMLVYIDDEDMIDEYSWATVEFDEGSVATVESVGRVPTNWKDYSERETVCAIGNRWVLSNENAVLRVPTAIIPGEFNYIINLSHPAIDKIKFGPVHNFLFDKRLARKERAENN